MRERKIWITALPLLALATVLLSSTLLLPSVVDASKKSMFAGFFGESNNTENLALLADKEKRELKKVEWKDVNPSDIAENNVKCQEATIALPVSYDQPKGGDTVDIYVKRYIRGDSSTSIKKRVWAYLAPRKNQSTDVQVWSMFSRYKDDVIIYVVDPRGTKKSSPPVNSWGADFTNFANSFRFSLPAMSITSIAHDLVEIVKRDNLEEPCKDNGDCTHYVEATGLWAKVAVRALLIAPNMFKAMLLEGLEKTRTVSDMTIVEKELFDQCSLSSFCKATVGDPAKLPSLIPTIGNPDFNECTAYFYEKFASYELSSCDTLGYVLNALLQGDAKMEGTVNFHPAILTIPLVHSMSQCGNVAGFKKAMDFLKGSLTPYTKPSAVLEKAATKDFLEYYHAANETFDFKSAGEQPATCATACIPTFSNMCLTYDALTGFRNYFKSHLYELDDYALSHPASKKTKLYVLAGELDFRTPALLAEKYALALNSKAVVHKILKLGHMDGEMPCMEEFTAAMQDPENEELQKKANACVNESNNNITYDWEFKETNLNKIDWWGLNADGTAQKLKKLEVAESKYPARYEEPKKSVDVAIIVIAVSITLIGMTAIIASTVVYVYRKRQRKRSTSSS